MVYLIDHPPARSQFAPRGTRPTGLTVVHTAESVLDTVGPDTGAESVAAFIARRTTPGSYHDLVDSDTALQLVRYEDQAYQDATGSNPYALSISFALRTTDWRVLTPDRRRAFLRQGAVAFARQQAWLRSKGYPTTPLRRITREESSRGVAGFISHAERDPGRRTDPGSDFPWTDFFAECRAALAGSIPQEDDMPITDADARKVAEAVLDVDLGGGSLADFIRAFRPGEAGKREAGPLYLALAGLADDEAKIVEAIRSGQPATAVLDPDQLEELKAAIREAETDADADAAIDALWRRLAPPAEAASTTSGPSMEGG